jgi:hypothetical protein
MANSYPIIRYPKPVLEEIAKIKPGVVRKASGVKPKIALPPKTKYLLDFHWYMVIVCVLAANLLVYQLASIPALALLAGATIGLLIKYAIDHSRWVKKRSLAIRRSKVPEPKTEAPKATKRTCPKWINIINLEVSDLTSEAQIGVSEKFFFDHLKKHFPQARFGRKYPHPDRDEKYWYSSDLEIVAAALGIQVEIDEPYAGKKGTPHHCSDSGKDSERDAFFLERNWIIIRFAEIQVVTEPMSCCLAVAKVFAELTGDTTYLESIGKCDLPNKVPTWTVAQAKKMAKRDFRHSYLKPAGLWKEPASTSITSRRW